jgi:NTP pyrophosphatase (non-canonical NTP hydrolase)
MFAALVEEVGELAKALMEHDRGLGTSTQQVLREAVQVACMAIRVATEGDSNFTYLYPLVEDELPKGPVSDRF